MLRRSQQAHVRILSVLSPLFGANVNGRNLLQASGFDRPVQAFGQRTPHDPFPVGRRNKVHVFGEQLYALAVAAAGALEHGRDVGAPEAASWPEGLQ